MKIKSCPWDNNKEHTQKVKSNKWFTNVYCSCGARGPNGYTKEEAIEKWNRYIREERGKR